MSLSTQPRAMAKMVPRLSSPIVPLSVLAELSQLLGKAMPMLKALLGPRLTTRLLKLLTKALSFSARLQPLVSLLANVMPPIELIQPTPMALLLVVVWLATRLAEERRSSRLSTRPLILLSAGLMLECPTVMEVKLLGRAIQLRVWTFL